MFSNYSELGAPLMTDQSKKERATFTLAPSHTTLANSIVRIIQSKVPTISFKTEPPEESEVQIIKNTTPLPNEMLAHRIGMIPIALTTVDEFDPKKYRIELNVANTGQESLVVTTKDFKVFTQDAEGWHELTPEETARWFPADSITKDHIMITTLRPQWSADSLEQIEIVAYPSVATGEENVRYSPVCQCSYGLTIDPDQSRQESFFQSWLIESKRIKDTAQVNPTQLNTLRREWKTLEIQRCFLVDKKNEPYSFDFEIETNGIMSVPAVVHRGIRELKKLIQKYESMDMKIPAGVNIQATLGARKGVEIIFNNNEDHTLGNLLQTYLVERHIQADVAPRLAYASYKMGHPLKKELILEIGAPDATEMTARKAIVEVVKYLMGVLDNMEREWMSLTGIGPASSDLGMQGPATSDLGMQGPATSDLGMQGPATSDLGMQGPSANNTGALPAALSANNTGALPPPSRSRRGRAV